VYENGRCRFHGGLSTGPKTAEGRARALLNLKRRWATRRGDADLAAAIAPAREADRVAIDTADLGDFLPPSRAGAREEAR
jgi:hypothetical protein